MSKVSRACSRVIHTQSSLENRPEDAQGEAAEENVQTKPRNPTCNTPPLLVSPKLCEFPWSCRGSEQKTKFTSEQGLSLRTTADL